MTLEQLQRVYDDAQDNLDQAQQLGNEAGIAHWAGVAGYWQTEVRKRQAIDQRAGIQ